MRNLSYWIVLLLPPIALIFLISWAMVLIYVGDLKLFNLADQTMAKVVLIFGLFVLGWLLVDVIYDRWFDFVHTRFFPLEKQIDADFEGWNYWAPASATTFSAKHFPAHSTEEFDRSDLQDSWCVLVNSFYCILMRSDRFRFELIEADEGDEDDGIGVLIHERSSPATGIPFYASSKRTRSMTDSIVSEALNVPGVLPVYQQTNIIDSLSNDFAAEAGLTIDIVDYSGSEVFTESVNGHGLVFSSIVFSVKANNETEESLIIFDQVEYHLFCLHIFSADAVKRLEVTMLGDVSEAHCEFAENFLRGIAVDNFGYIWQCSGFDEGFLKKTSIDRRG